MNFTFDLPELRIPSKKNSYRVHRSGSRLWIAPTDEVKRAETAIAYKAKIAIKQHLGCPLTLTVTYSGRMDLDNALGVILDGIEKSGRIENDRQFQKILIKRGNPRGKGISVRIEPMGEHT